MSTAAKPASSRERSIDVVKGLVMFLVVLCHVIGGLVRSRLNVSSDLQWIAVYAYSFFMPLMFLVSGVWVEHSLRHGIKRFLVSKAQTLLYPFVLWSFIHGGIQRMAGSMANGSADPNPLRWLLDQPVGPMWFFQYLFAILVMYALLRQAKLPPLLIACLGLIVVLAGGQSLPDPMVKGAQLFAFFALGSAGRDWVRGEASPIPSYAFPIVGALTLGVQLYILKAQSGVVPYGWLSLTVALLGSVAAIGLLKPITETALGRVLDLLGRYSLSIFVVHTIAAAATRMALLRVAKVDEVYVHVVLETLIGLIIPLAFYSLTEKRLPWLWRYPSRKQKQEIGAAVPVAANP